jgi:hypothetical protein
VAIVYTANHKNRTTEYPLALTTGGRIHYMQDSVTIAGTEGTATMSVTFPKLLPGKVVVIPAISWMRADDAQAGALLALGYNAFVDSAGVTQPAVLNYWLSAAAVGAGDLQGLIPAITGVTTAGARPATFDAQDGLEVVMTVTVANADVGDVYALAMGYVFVQ